MNKQSIKPYDLGERTFQFALQIRRFVRSVPKTISGIEDCKQLVRSSGSVGANYIESIEALSDKDAIYRKKICRKEAKESLYWLKLIDVNSNTGLVSEKNSLIQESQELMNIFGSIIRKKEANKII